MHNLLVVSLIIISIKSILFADSPLTSIEFSKAYNNTNIVIEASLSNGVLTERLMSYLVNPAKPIDLKMAVINELGWEDTTKNNTDLFFAFLQKKYGYQSKKAFLEKGKSQELLSMAYIMAMGNYFDVDEAIAYAYNAKQKKPDSFTYNLILALIQAQTAIDKEETWCYVYTVSNDVRDSFTSSSRDMKEEAIEIIFEYMNLYKEYCTVNDKEILCKQLLSGSIYNRQLEKVCSFDKGLSNTFVKLYVNNSCAQILNEKYTINLPKEIALDTDNRLQVMGKTEFCKGNQSTYFELVNIFKHDAKSNTKSSSKNFCIVKNNYSEKKNKYEINFNEHGAILKSKSQTIYLGKSCDAYSKQYGNGQWGFYEDNNTVWLGFKGEHQYTIDDIDLTGYSNCKSKKAVKRAYQATDYHITEEQKTSMKTVLRVDGYIDEALYNSFWKDIRGKVPESEIEELRTFIPMAQKTQLAIWKAVGKSIEQKKVYRSEELNKILAIMKQNSNSRTTYDNTLKLLESAASGKPMKVHGQLRYINIDLVNEVLSGLEASMERFDMLLADTWKLTMKERHLNKHFSILWYLPFVETIIPFENNLIQKQYMSTIDENSWVLLAINKNPNAGGTQIAVTACVKNIVASVDANNPVIDVTSFRKTPSASTSIVFNADGDKAFLSAQCVLHDNQLISSISLSNNAIDSVNNHQGLMDNLQLK
ncbi:MAG: hypothetical protein WBG65_01335 [Sulfurimonadaceae bacterium]